MHRAVWAKGRWWLAGALWALGGAYVGCGGDPHASPPPDAGEPDAGEPDASEPDASEPDASEPDASEPDASEPDASEPDASEPDAGEPEPSRGYDVFLLAGQSNMVGRGAPFDPLLDEEHPLIFQWGRGGEREGQIVPATARLDHNDPALPDRVGMGLSFAKAYVASQANPRPVLLVPAARGGSSFSAQQWNVGDPLFEDAVARANEAMAADSGNRFVAVLWHQGENDVGQLSAANYRLAQDALIRGFRAQVQGAAQAPFVLGQFCPDWAVNRAGQAELLGIINATPARLARTAVAPSAGLRGQAGDLVHFDAPSMRSYGERYFDALKRLLP